MAQKRTWQPGWCPRLGTGMRTVKTERSKFDEACVSCLSVSQDYCNDVPQTGLKHQNFLLSPFWRLEICNQAGSWGPSLKSLGVDPFLLLPHSHSPGCSLDHSSIILISASIFTWLPPLCLSVSLHGVLPVCLSSHHLPVLLD